MLFCWRTEQPVAASEFLADWICRGVGTSKLDWCWGDHERLAVTLGPPIRVLPNNGLKVNPEMELMLLETVDWAGGGPVGEQEEPMPLSIVRRFEFGLVLALLWQLLPVILLLLAVVSAGRLNIGDEDLADDGLSRRSIVLSSLFSRSCCSYLSAAGFDNISWFVCLFVCFRDKRICNILDLLFIVCTMSISLRVYATTRKTRWPPFGSLIYFRRRQT